MTKMTNKKKIIERLMAISDELKNYVILDEEGLKKCKGEDLIIALKRWENTKVVEVMEKEEAEKIIDGSCGICKEKLDRAEGKVLVNSEYHVIGVL